MAFWITLFRGMLAIALGVALIFQPDKALPMLANFMGVYWLVSGIVSLRWGVHGERARGLSLLAGAVGVLAGLGMLSLRLITATASEKALFSMLGLIILLTGLLHIFGGFRTDPEEVHLSSQPRLRIWPRTWSWSAFLLGLFEMVLGLLLVLEPMRRGSMIYLAASVWALVGGVVLIGDAVRIRRLQQTAAQPVKQEAEPAADDRG